MGTSGSNPLAFADDRIAEGMLWRMKCVAGSVELYKSRFER